VLRIHKISYKLEVVAPLRIGSGIQIGNLNLAKSPSSRYYIPGNTLRGLIGKQLLKIVCQNLRHGKVPNCKICKENCAYRSLIANNRHGEGAYFHFGVIEDRLKLISIPMIRLLRDRKVVEKERAPFFYQAVVPEKGNTIHAESQIYVVNADEDSIEALRQGILLSKYQCIGGRRSWGWGFIKDTKITEIKEISIEFKEETLEEITLKLITPLPIDKNYGIQGTIIKALKTLTSLGNINQKNILVKIRSPFRLIPIGYWSEIERKPYTELALGENTVLIIEGKIPQFVKDIASIFGISLDNKWYTKAGYGIAEHVKNL